MRSLDDLLTYYLDKNNYDWSAPAYNLKDADNLYGAAIAEWITLDIPGPDTVAIAALEKEMIDAGLRAEWDEATRDIAHSDLTSKAAGLLSASVGAVEAANELESLFTNANLRNMPALVNSFTRLVTIIKGVEEATVDTPEPFIFPQEIIDAWNAMAANRILPSALYYPAD